MTYQMKRFINKIFSLAILPCIILLLIAIYNISIDPFGVIKGDMSKQKTEPNQHYLKTKYILNNPEKHNAFVFGNSRVGKIDVSKINDGNRWYNMAYSEGLPSEHLRDMELFLEGGVDIKKVLMGIDEISCFVSPKSHSNQSLRKQYNDRLSSYLEYLFLVPSYHMYKKIRDAPKTDFYSSGTYETIYETGSLFPNLKDEYIENNPDLHIQDSVFKKAYWPESNSDKISSTLNTIQQIRDLCVQENIELIIFVNPMYVETYKEAVSHGFLNFIEQLPLDDGYYDFSGVNEITTNRLNYYENSHYRPLIGDFVIREIFSKNKLDSKYWVK